MGLPQLRKSYDDLLWEKKYPAIEFLKKLTKEDAEEIRKAIKADPKSWFAGYHFNWGMWVRNQLRSAGYGENYFGIQNLDDIYCELVEDAVAV